MRNADVELYLILNIGYLLFWLDFSQLHVHWIHMCFSYVDKHDDDDDDDDYFAAWFIWLHF